MPAKVITPEFIEKAKALRSQDMGYDRIAKELGVSANAVWMALNPKNKPSERDENLAENGHTGDEVSWAGEISKEPKDDRKPSSTNALRPRVLEHKGAMQTTDLNPFSLLAVKPTITAFTIDSTTLWVAKEVVQKLWGWPDYSVEDFLDTYLTLSLRSLGVDLVGWKVVPPLEAEDAMREQEQSQEQPAEDQEDEGYGDSRPETGRGQAVVPTEGRANASGTAGPEQEPDGDTGTGSGDSLQREGEGLEADGRQPAAERPSDQNELGPEPAFAGGPIAGDGGADPAH